MSGLERGCLPSGAQEQATNLLAHARCLLEQQASHQHALEQCLAVLQAAPPEAYFFFTLDPPTLTAAAYKRPGSAKARRLRPRFAAALQQTRRRQEALRLNTLSALVRLGVPVALWHFLALTPLPGSVPELAPQPSVAGS